jgi:hypothetical protein
MYTKDVCKRGDMRIRRMEETIGNVQLVDLDTDWRG